MVRTTMALGKGELLMWTYNKVLEYPINIKCSDPRLAKVIISQYGGPDGELALKTIWIDDNYFNARSMDVYITKLRKHLKDDDQIEIINIHGKGI